MSNNIPSNTHIIATPKPITVNLTPYAMAVFSSDLDVAIKSIDTSTRFSAAKFFLICLSIELAIKSTLLSLGLPKGNVHGHDLDDLLQKFVKSINPSFITAKDEKLIQQAVRFYSREPGSSKGIVYFEANMKEQALKGYKDLPKIKDLENIHRKFQRYLKKNDLNIG